MSNYVLIHSMFISYIQHAKFSAHDIIIVTKMGLEILVCEDYKDLAESYRMILQERGHQVTVTTDGIECLQVYRNSLKHDKETRSNFDVVLLDQKMPGMNGIDVAKAIQQLNPQQRLIFVTGYSNEVVTNLKDMGENIEIMNKPFQLQALITQVEGKSRLMWDKQISQGFKKWDGYSGTSTLEGSRKVRVEPNKNTKINVTEYPVKNIERQTEGNGQTVSIQEDIQKIADRISLLALNVAVEAVRVKDEEKRSIVFADEVRRLAEGSAKASEEVDVLIKHIQKNTEATVTNVEG